jgi:hypothetical protein
MLARPYPADPEKALDALITGGASIGHLIVYGLGLMSAAGDLDAVKLIAGRPEPWRNRHHRPVVAERESMTAVTAVTTERAD